MAVPPTFASRTVLVVDDYEDLRLLIVDCFAEAGFNVESAADGAQAVACASSLPVHAIVMDLQMPVMDGYEAVRQIRAAHGRRTYVLAISADGSDQCTQDAHAAGFDDVVIKPVSVTALIEMVTAKLDARAQ